MPASPFDVSRSLLPLDPRAPEFSAPGVGSGGVVPGVPLPGGVGAPTFAQRLRGVLRRARTGVAGGDFDFPDVPATTPTRPNALGTLTYGLQGFLEGTTRGRAAREAREERTEDRAFRREQLSAQTALEKERLRLEGERVRAADEQLSRATRVQAADFAAKNPQVASLARAAGVNPIALYTDYVTGKLPAEMESVLASGLALAAQDAALPEDLRAIVTFELGKLGPDATPEQQAKARAKALSEATATLADPLKRLKMTAHRQDLELTHLQAQTEAQRAQAGERNDTNVRALVAAAGDTFERTQAHVARLGAILYGGEQQGAAATLQLLGLDPAARTNAISALPDPAFGGKPAPELKKEYDAALQRLTDLEATQDTAMRALAERAGVALPERTKPGKTGAGTSETPPPSYRRPAADLFSSPEEFATAQPPPEGTRAHYAPGETPSSFVVPGGPIPGGPGGVRKLAALAAKGEAPAIAQIASDYALINADTNTPLTASVQNEDGSMTTRDLTYAEKFRFLQKLLERVGPEKFHNYVVNLANLPPTR